MKIQHVAIVGLALVGVLAIGAFVSAQNSAGTATTATATTTAAPASAATVLTPLPGMEAKAPTISEHSTVKLQTTNGDVMIEIYPQAGPNAARRFVELIESGFYNNTPISRVVPGFVAQFGVNWREPHKAWEDKPFDDDPSLFALERGTLAFAKAGPNTNSTQIFINYDDNSHLSARPYGFTTFAKVVKGMEVVDAFVEVGEPGMGLDQERLWADGEAYLKELTLKPSMIIKAEVVK
jgi:peptidyl-prolyl cis-trans isomerase A (cyclophilin A)